MPKQHKNQTGQAGEGLPTTIWLFTVTWVFSKCPSPASMSLISRQLSLPRTLASSAALRYRSRISLAGVPATSYYLSIDFSLALPGILYWFLRVSKAKHRCMRMHGPDSVLGIPLRCYDASTAKLGPTGTHGPEGLKASIWLTAVRLEVWRNAMNRCGGG